MGTLSAPSSNEVSAATAIEYSLIAAGVSFAVIRWETLGYLAQRNGQHD